ncbi:hypothetical protein [Rhodobacter lacus]|uniref:ABC transporter substrate-binding protein n=1 Tax=Rhodobacter lacus TaxID=1641972 RepID=A0ABW5A8T4_9RHOB
MHRTAPLSRRGFLAAGLAGLALPALPRPSLAMPSRDLASPANVLLTMPNAQALAQSLTRSLARAGGPVPLRLETAQAADFVTDPARLAALRGSRVVLIGTDADSVLFDIALGQHGARVMHRATHREDPATRLPIHGFETLADACTYDLARDHVRAGSSCTIRTPDAAGPTPLPAPAKDHWQARTLARVLAHATGRSDALPVIWQSAPRAFATLIADL